MEGATFFLSFLYSSFIGSGIALLIMLIKILGNSKFGARWHYCIWFLLLARLLSPFTPGVPRYVSEHLSSFLNKLQVRELNISVLPNQLANNHSSKAFTGFTPDYALSVTEDFFHSHLETIILIWLAGVLIISIFTIIRNVRIRNLLKNRQEIQCQEIIELFKSCLDKCRIKARISLAQNEFIPSPIITGIFNPCLLLPISVINEFTLQEIEYIFLHEVAHYKQKDIMVTRLVSALQILHWFNPILWLAFVRMNQDREIACNAYALSFLGPEHCKPYGETIIAILLSFSSRYGLAATSFIRSKSHLKQRISMIQKHNKETRFEIILKTVVFVIVGFSLLMCTSLNTAVLANNIPPLKEEIFSENLSSYFKVYDGSFILLDEKEGKCYVYNEQKAKERISPCSTFKIITALIALQTGLLNDEFSMIQWDGTDYPFADWNRDHTLESAMKYSVDWYFQKISLQIGQKNMQEYVQSTAYGNQDLSGGITNFWQQSSLKISPLEQVAMLKDFFNYQMPFSPENIDTVKKTIRLSEQKGAILSGKTGSGIVDGKYINGWFVGYVEKGDNVYYFATNIQDDGSASGREARNITLSILNDKGIY